MQEEFDYLVANLTLELLTLLEGKYALISQWVFKIKSQLNPTYLRLKARLIARDLKQKFVIDYNKTFVQVVCCSTLLA